MLDQNKFFHFAEKVAAILYLYVCKSRILSHIPYLNRFHNKSLSD